MGYSTPGLGDASSAGKTGVMEGGAVGVGEALGRSFLGPGLGTAVGGIAVAAAADGTARDRMATIALERAVNEVL